MKSAILASVALAISSIALTACQEEAKEEAAPEGMPGVSVANARLVLPAVKGNPGVVYFDATLRKVEVAGAKDAMMHDTITQNGVSQMAPSPFVNLPKGETLKFAPGGKHVMAMDLDPSLAAGGTTEVTLTFAGGDKTTVDAQIQPPGSN
jgi:periplasmic copper chaperone A